MKPAPFEYHRPTTVEQAVELSDEHDEAEFMAGNQSLGIVMANRLATPDHVIDLGDLEECSFVEVEDATVRIGALTTHRDVERSDALAEAMPMWPEAAGQIAGPRVRNRGTVGGSIGEADPAGNYPTVLTALDGTISLRSTDGDRTVDARDFFVAYMFTELRAGELITEVAVDRDPFPVDRTGMAFSELKRAAQTWPTLSAAAAVRVADPSADDPVVEEARLALANADDVPLHVPGAEDAVEGTTLDGDDLAAAGTAARDAADPPEEMHADEPFKLDVAEEYARRALATAHRRAGGRPAPRPNPPGGPTRDRVRGGVRTG
jgi:carbon-monoxide dehydrogenase medium subunit